MKVKNTIDMNAYFAGGCFWCITEPFYDIDGVIKVESGFSGGDEINPNYEDVKAQKTSHRETIKVIYDESKVDYKTLLDTFLNHVDLTDDGGQFIDRGFSYTLAIFYNNVNEEKIIRKTIKEIEDKYNIKACVSVLPFKNFYIADEYHQDYFRKNKEEYLKEMIESGRRKNIQN